nr:hypothetical protein Iba_chr01bCG17010 [Ipomoea batatas]
MRSFTGRGDEGTREVAESQQLNTHDACRTKFTQYGHGIMKAYQAVIPRTGALKVHWNSCLFLQCLSVTCNTVKLSFKLAGKSEK